MPVWGIDSYQANNETMCQKNNIVHEVLGTDSQTCKKSGPRLHRRSPLGKRKSIVRLCWSISVKLILRCFLLTGGESEDQTLTTTCRGWDRLEYLLSDKRSLDQREWGTWRLWKSCDFPLVEEMQHCNITWILYKYLIRQKVALFHGVIINVNIPFWWDKNLSVCACWDWKKSSNNLSMVYWLVLWFIRFIYFSEMACVIMNYPGDSIDCQLELSLQYLYSGKIILVCL